MAALKIAIVAARFNAEITERLIAGAQEALRGLAEVSLFQVPGAFEIPLAAKQAALSKRFDAIVAIGCVIRGETAHFEYISHVASTGIAQVSLETGVPVTFGVLTVDTDEQAMARSVPGGDNKGYHAAQAAVEMVRILKKLA
ncbi:MAG TPA: 6,7-dimethyl-8-ribityllumazine synthase [Terriglobia bacterium]|nr:6,7-dimethyl-8-ribityllumazine synthase [Terriglobia bacterium]